MNGPAGDRVPGYDLADLLGIAGLGEIVGKKVSGRTFSSLVFQIEMKELLDSLEASSIQL